MYCTSHFVCWCILSLTTTEVHMAQDKRLFTASTVALGTVLALLWLLDSKLSPAAVSVSYAAPPLSATLTRTAYLPLVRQGPGSRFVATTGSDSGNDCVSNNAPCATVQHAVDVAAPGDEIRVATGVYTGVQVREGITQVVYISKSLTVRGGYTTTNWTVPDPTNNPTTLDAQTQGRVMVITGTITATVEGMRMTNGMSKQGSGVYVVTATAILSGNFIVGNTAIERYCDNTSCRGKSYGGGLYLFASPSVLVNNIISGNNAGSPELGLGGGIYLLQSPSLLNRNTIIGNSASGGYIQYRIIGSGYGGGLHLDQSPATLGDNLIANNRVSGSTACGGGAYLTLSAAVVNDNHFLNNSASSIGFGCGGAIAINQSPATLSGNAIMNNRASSSTIYTSIGRGGGAYLEKSNATLSNNLIIGNVISTSASNYGNAADGGGLALDGSPATLSGNVIEANQTSNPYGLGHGGGLYTKDSDPLLVNNALVDNQSDSGAGAYIASSHPRFLHTTVARNFGGDGTGIYVTRYKSPASYDPYEGPPSTAMLTNTIIFSQSLGIRVVPISTAILNGVLWFNNSANIDTTSAGYLTVTSETVGDPAFASDGYHLTPYSLAIGRGVEAGVTSDIDGQPRDQYPDLGADEYVFTPLNAVVISGVKMAVNNKVYVFMATVSPLSATQPIVYLWEASEQPVITRTLTSPMDVMEYNWGSTGAKVISLTALNAGSVVYASHTVAIGANTPLSGVVISGPVTGLNATPYVFVANITPLSATQPITYVWQAIGQSTLIHADRGISDSVIFTWTLPGLQLITVTASNAGGRVSDEHVINLESSTRYVAMSGSDSGNNCLNSDAPCATVQHAVDEAQPGHEIRVAAGTYTDVYSRAGGMQVVYISKTVIIRGGYTTTNWTTPDPAANPTTLDAHRQGGVIFIIGARAVVISGLRITGGTKGGDWSSGGIFALGSTVLLDHNFIFSNTNTIQGGGVSLFISRGTLNDNVISDNFTTGSGGGVKVFNNYDPAMGGTTLIHNVITGNTGGGVYVQDDSPTLSGNVIVNNTALGGGGLFIDGLNTNGSFVNNVIVDNYASSRGPGVYVQEAHPSLLHNTIAGNSGGDGSGISIYFARRPVVLTNTILVNQAMGITITSGSTATLNGVLWFGDGAKTNGAGFVGITNETIGDPAFAPDGYHLTITSAAIDRGVDAGVTADIDGDPRPFGAAPDLGADEFYFDVRSRAYFPVVSR